MKTHDYVISFSIPGRIRFNYNRLYKNVSLKESLEVLIPNITGVTSINTNTYTCSILIKYNTNKLSQNNLIQEINSLINKVDFTEVTCPNNKNSLLSKFLSCISLKNIFFGQKGYSSDRVSFSKNVFKIGFLITCSIFITTGNFLLSLCILILYYPGIYSFIPYIASYYCEDLLKKRNILILNPDKFLSINNCSAVLIDDNLLLNASNQIEEINYELKDKRSIYNLVNNIRILGFTDIYLLSHTDSLNMKNYADYIGIEPSSFTNSILHNKNIIVIITKECFNKANMFKNDKDVYIGVIQSNIYPSPLGDITVSIDNINFIPNIFFVSKTCENSIVNCESIALAFNSLGALICTLTSYNPLIAISIYFTSLINSFFYMKFTLENKKKELTNEI